MKQSYNFKFYIGKELLTKEKNILSKMEHVASTYDFLDEENVLQYLEDSSHVCCMLKDDELVGFSWIALCENLNIAELCWFVTHKNKIKGLEGKLLLDKTLEFCKQHNINSVKFNCAAQSWGKIKDKEKLLKKFGYDAVQDEDDYDISINI